MQKKMVIILTTLIGITLFLSGIIIYRMISISYSPPPIKSQCNTLITHEGATVNLLFFSDKLTAQSYSDALLSHSPYKDFKNKLNVYFISNYTPQCEIYKGVALLCYSKDLMKTASVCPSDYIIVVDKNQQASMRSSTYMNVLSLNAAQSSPVFFHEFAHAFANLADEYVPASLPYSSKNCVNDCSSFQGLNQGCFSGCSDSDHMRSIDRGLMRTLSSEDYGEFNEKILSSRFGVASSPTANAIDLNGDVTPDCFDKKFYLIEASFDKSTKNISLVSRSIHEGCSGSNGYGEGEYAIIDAQEDTSLEGSFNPVYIFTDAPKGSEIDGEVFNSDKPFFLRIPATYASYKITVIIKNEKESSQLTIPLNDIGARACKL